MLTVNSISGGKTSAYVAANYSADYNLFALVRTEDKKCMFPDRELRKLVEDRIQKPFIGTLEDDVIIYTMLDLEQYLGTEITWVSGITYEEVLTKKGGWLPNKLHRYCTTHLKIEPMFYWWLDNIREPVYMRIGYRANEVKRKQRKIDGLNKNGYEEFFGIIGTWEVGPNTGKNKWSTVSWCKPEFPLIDDQPIYKDQVNAFWNDKPVRFAELNNCVGCFHRSPLLLRKMFDKHPCKMEWFNRAEIKKTKKQSKATWRSDVTYQQIKDFQPQTELAFEDFSECDSGYCET